MLFPATCSSRGVMNLPRLWHHLVTQLGPVIVMARHLLLGLCEVLAQSLCDLIVACDVLLGLLSDLFCVSLRPCSFFRIGQFLFATFQRFSGRTPLARGLQFFLKLLGLPSVTVTFTPSFCGLSPLALSELGQFSDLIFCLGHFCSHALFSAPQLLDELLIPCNPYL